jgi:hypothetical protein
MMRVILNNDHLVCNIEKGKYGCAGEPREHFRARMLALKAWLEDRPEDVIAMVCHWG